MGNSLFSSKKSVDLNFANERDIIRKLTVARISEYDLLVVNQEFSKEDFNKLPPLISELGNQLLKANLISSRGLSAYKEVSAFFKTIIEELYKAHHIILISFAAQLLQFYTIVCEPSFRSHSSYTQWQKFLSDKAIIFGSINNNLFITEYSLILLYNDLCSLIDKCNDAEPNKEHDCEMDLASLNFRAKKLEELKEQIKQWHVNAPDNIFVHYLMFIQQYTVAKLLELHFLIDEKKLSDEAKLQLVDKQTVQIALAKDSIDTMIIIKKKCAEIGIKFAQGTEYTLGQSLFSKFPETTIESFAEQLTLLMSA